MNRFRYISPVISALLFILLVSAALAQRGAPGSANHFDKIRARMDWFYRQRAFPLKHIPPGARLKALQQLKRMPASAEQALLNTASSSSSSAWTLIGPQPTIPDLNSFDGAPTVSGRVTALAADPTNPGIVYLGAAEGGIWKTTNGGTSWSPLTDTQVSLAVGSIAIDPSNHTTVYVGTGEENFNADAYFGAGILKSTDGGSTWTHLNGPFAGPFGADNISGGAFIGALAVSPANSQVLLAGIFSTSTTNGSGIYRSADGGNTWNLALGGDEGTSVIFDPTNGNTVYAALGNPAGDPLLKNGVYKSTDGGQTWVEVLAETSTTGNIIGRIALAVAPSSPTTLYAAVENPNPLTCPLVPPNTSAPPNCLLGLFKTTDGFNTFTKLTNTPDFCSPQCFYNIVVAVAPNNPNVVYAGGLNQGIDHTVIRSLDGGNSWSTVSVGSNGGTVHTDAHALAFSGDSSTLYAGSDGGVWSTTTVATSPVNWASLNSTLALTQFYNGLSIHPTNPLIGFGGAQDNGIQQYTGSLTWSVVGPCGDGGYTAIDFTNPTNVYETGGSITGEFICLEKSTASGGMGTFLDSSVGIDVNDPMSFIPPLVMDPSNSSTLYVGTFRVYQTTNGALTWTPISQGLTATGTLTTIAVAPSNSNTVYAGSDDASVSVTTNAGSGAGATWVPISPPCPRAVTHIAVDPVSSTRAYVTYSGFSGFVDTVGHVFKTTNGGASFTDISGNLPNIPVNAIVVDPDIANTLYIATDIGVFVTNNGGTAWSMLGTGLPNVAVLALSLQHATRTLRAGTHGRSAWDLSLPTATLPIVSAISPTSALAGSAAFTLSVSGSNFVSGAVVNFNGQPQPTTFVSSTSLTAAISAASIVAAGSFSVTVTNPPPNGGTSPTSTFTVNNPLPVLNSISPTSVAVGSPAFTLSVSGSNFNASSVVNFNAQPVSTTFVSSTALTASIPATDAATAATDSVTVSNPAPGGGTSTAASFSVSTSDFVLNVAGGGTATITAGQTAIYKNAVSLTDVNGFSFSVVLSCSTNAPMSTCSAAPSTLTQGTNATIRVFTIQHGSALPFANRWRPPTGILRHAPIWLFLMLAVLFLVFGGQKRRRFALSIPLALVLLSIIFESACASNPTGGTSAGNYTVSVTGVSGTMAHTITLGLTVK